MQAIGIISGIIMVISAFLPWETYVGEDSVWLIRISYFLGIQNNSFDSLLRLEFLPLAATLLLMLSFSLVKKHVTWKITALLTSLICLVIGTYDILHFYLSWFERVPGVGLWIFTILALLCFVLSLLAITKKQLLEKKLFTKIFDSGTGDTNQINIFKE